MADAEAIDPNDIPENTTSLNVYYDKDCNLDLIKGKVKPPQPEAEKVPGPGTCTIFLRQTRKTTCSMRRGR